MKNKPKVKKVNWFWFDHKEVNKKFTGGLTFLNFFSVKGTTDWVPVAVYKVKKPDTSKGHKKYMLLNKKVVAGMTQKEINKYRYQDAIHCLECNTVLYSIDRHHFHHCGCDNQTMIDGGRDYTRTGAIDLSKTKMVLLDLLTDKVIPDFNEKFKKIVNNG